MTSKWFHLSTQSGPLWRPIYAHPSGSIASTAFLSPSQDTMHASSTPLQPVPDSNAAGAHALNVSDNRLAHLLPALPVVSTSDTALTGAISIFPLSSLQKNL